MKKMLFIYNPKSGKGKIKASLPDIIDVFTKGGYYVTAYPTQAKGDCVEKVSECVGEFDVVVVSGGDGTLNECVKGMIMAEPEKRAPIGYIPAGTMNDFAASHGISRDMIRAAKNIVNGRTIKYDIGELNGQTFIYVAAFGAFTEVSYDSPQLQKNLFGSAAYLVEGIKSIPKIEGVNVRVSSDEGIYAEENVLICLVMNSTRVGGFKFGDYYDVDVSDGLFEIVIIPRSNNIANLSAVITNIMNGKRNSDGVHVISTANADIEIEKPVKWTLDGEFGGEFDKVDIKVMHNAVEFIVEDKDKV